MSKPDHRKLIRKIALQKSTGEAAARVAEDLAALAHRLDPASEYTVEPGELVVNGFNRKVATVVCRTEGAADREFGRTGKPGVRALGRASAALRG